MATIDQYLDRAQIENACGLTPPTRETMDLPRLIKEHSLATQRMCRAFDRGEIERADGERQTAKSYADEILNRFAAVQAAVGGAHEPGVEVAA